MFENDPETLPLAAWKMESGGEWHAMVLWQPYRCLSRPWRQRFEALLSESWQIAPWSLLNVRRWEACEALPQGYLSLAHPLFSWEAILKQFLIVPSVLKTYLHYAQSIAADFEALRIDSKQIFLQPPLQPFGAFCFECHPSWYVGYRYNELVPLIISSFHWLY